MNKRNCAGTQEKHPAFIGTVGAPRRGARKIIVHPWITRAAGPAAPTDCTGSQVKKCIPGAVGAPRRGARKIIVHPWITRALRECPANHSIPYPPNHLPLKYATISPVTTIRKRGLVLYAYFFPYSLPCCAFGMSGGRSFGWAGLGGSGFASCAETGVCGGQTGFSCAAAAAGATVYHPLHGSPPCFSPSHSPLETHPGDGVLQCKGTAAQRELPAR